MPSPLAAMLASAIGGPSKIQGALPSKAAPPPIAQPKAPPPKAKLPGKNMKEEKNKAIHANMKNKSEGFRGEK
jgi:hypothetical protein